MDNGVRSIATVLDLSPLRGVIEANGRLISEAGRKAIEVSEAARLKTDIAPAFGIGREVAR